MKGGNHGGVVRMGLGRLYARLLPWWSVWGVPESFLGLFVASHGTGFCHLFSSFLGWSCLSRPIGLTVQVEQRLDLFPDRLKALWRTVGHPLVMLRG